jgi:hypothetical protein
MLLPSEESWRAKRESLVADTIDVAPFVVDSILRYARH